MRPEFRDALIAEVLSWGDHRRLADPPRSAEGERQAALSADVHVQWFLACLKNGEFIEGDGWPEVVPSSDVYYSYLSWCRAKQVSGRRLSLEELILHFADYLGASDRAMKHQRDLHTGRVDLSMTKRLRVRRLLPLQLVREMWDRSYRTKTAWPEIDTEPVQKNFDEFETRESNCHL